MTLTVEADVDSGELREGLFRFIDQEVLPIQATVADLYEDPRKYWQEDGRLSPRIDAARREARMASARAGYYSMFCPTELGGGGLGARTYFDVWEGLVHRYGSPMTQLPFYVLAHTSTGPTALWSQASDALKEVMLPKLVKGETQGSFAMSEPGAGSDAWMMTTRARSDGDGWILNGTKQWASWGPSAEFLITFAVTDDELFAQRRGGLTCFFVPADAPGYRLDSIVEVYNELGGEECIISFNDVRVPDEYRIGPVGDGFRVAMQGSNQLKLTKFGRIIGIAVWALDQVIEYAEVRRTFGHTLAEHQTVQNMLAESCIEVHAAKLMAIDLATKLDAGQPALAEIAMSHAFTAEAMYRVDDRSMQIFGGMGLTNELGLIDGWHHLRTARLAEGPTELQLRAVANHLMKGRMPF